MGSEDEGSESEVSDDDEDEEKRALLEKLLNAEIKSFVKMVIDPATQILVNINEPVKFRLFDLYVGLMSDFFLFMIYF